MAIVKLQRRPSGKYYSLVITLPKDFEGKLKEKLGEVPYGFDIELDKKGNLKGEPVLLKKVKH